MAFSHNTLGLCVAAYFVGKQCDSLIGKATQIIEEMLSTPAGRAKLVQLFNLCEPIVTDEDAATFMSDLMGNWMGAGINIFKLDTHFYSFD